MIQKCFEFLFDLVVAHGVPSTLHMHVEGWVPVGVVLAMWKVWCNRGKSGGGRKKQS